jgi:hypothetical protein
MCINTVGGGGDVKSQRIRLKNGMEYNFPLDIFQAYLMSEAVV